MDYIHIAKVYANAFLEVASDAGKLGEYEEELQSVVSMFEGNEDVWNFFLSPKVGKAQKLKVIEAALEKRVSVHVSHFVSVVISHDRISIIHEIFRQFSLAKDKLLGRKRAYIYSSQELKAPEVEEIRNILNQKFSSECVIETQVKPEVLGGFVIRFDDIVIDGSIKSQLEKMKKQLLSTNLQSGTLYED